MNTVTVALISTGVLATGLGFLLSRLFFLQTTQKRFKNQIEQSRNLFQEADQQLRLLDFDKQKRFQDDWRKKRASFEEAMTESRRGIRREKEIIESKLANADVKLQQIQQKEEAMLQATLSIERSRAEIRDQQQKAGLISRSAQELFDEADRLLDENKAKANNLVQQIAVIEQDKGKIDELKLNQELKLEAIAGLSRDEARRQLIDQLTGQAKFDAASMIKEIRDEARLTANKDAKKIILNTIQRTAASHTIENTVSVVNIQSDEMKGRIIGREGRNIRTFEAVTGIEVIVDDTPEAVILSGFDPVRREVARIALIRLLQDGRIHPARIEDVVEKVRTEIEDEIIEIGERTAIDLDLHGLHAGLTRMVGRMRFRTSYGQNLLSHSIEVAKLCSVMAAELGLDARMARRAGLLHDIGKVVEEDIGDPHALAGMALCERYKEHPDICNAVGAHHDEIEMTCLLAPIVQSADAISGARPGARREALESYIKRLENLENMASSFEGVDRVFAIQAGREIRVIVNHEIVGDAHAEQLALDIAHKIERDMQYPGQVKVTVIREIRAVSYAK